MDVLERLEAVEAIKALKARYFRCIDSKDWEGFSRLFADDAVMDMAEAAGGSPAENATSTGPAAITAYVRDAVDRMETVHHGHMPEIEVTGEATATGVWAMEDLLRWSGRDGTEHHLHGFGHYHERYVRVGGKWLIAEIRLTRLRVDVT